MMQKIGIFLLLTFLHTNLTAAQCTKDSDCGKETFCGGKPRCVFNRCMPALNSPCKDQPGTTCNEQTKSCDPTMCQTNKQCNDGLWCNGTESCNPSMGKGHFNEKNQVWGCHRTKEPCTWGCTESTNQCTQPNCDIPEIRDNDGDGHISIACGGNDCDDFDEEVNPSMTEICDLAHKDEDCNPKTIAAPGQDLDKDGFYPERCCNEIRPGELHCGTDCNDRNPLIVPMAQWCNNDGDSYVQVCGWGSTSCGDGKVCHAQPNGTGVCAP